MSDTVPVKSKDSTPSLQRNRSGNFSVERLMDFLIALGQDVEITVRPTRKEYGRVSIVLA